MLEIGFGKSTITPPLGTPLGGYENRTKNAIGVHDDVYARCILFKDTATGLHVALIVCDLLWVNYDFSDGVKHEVEQITFGKVPASNVILHAIHVHSSQRIEGGLTFYYKRIKKPHNIDKGWYVKYALPYLTRAIASSVYGAMLDLKPAVLRSGWSTADAGFNRREKDPAAAIVDQELATVLALNHEGNPLGANIRAVFYNLALHCVALGEENYFISADWPYWVAERLKKQLDLPWSAQVIFGQGTSGNTNPFNCKFGQEHRYLSDADPVGQRVADAVIRSLDLKTLQVISDPEKPADLSLHTREIFVEVKDTKKALIYKTLNLWWLGVVKQNGGLALKIRIHMLKANNLIFITTPGEPFGEFGVEIRKIVRAANPSFQPIILELTDGAIAYITTRDSYFNGKGYEATLAGSPETGYKILEAVREMVAGIGH